MMKDEFKIGILTIMFCIAVGCFLGGIARQFFLPGVNAWLFIVGGSFVFIILYIDK